MHKDAKTELSTIGSTQFLLLLHSVPHLGEKALIRLLNGSAQRRLSPEQILDSTAERLHDEFDLDTRAATYLIERRAELLTQSAAVAKSMRSYPLQVVSTSAATYPTRLVKFCDPPPPVLYTFGNLSLLEPVEPRAATDRYTFTIAASRGASAASLAALDELATRLAIRGGIPVTGHDRPEYQRLALAAQRRDLPSVYVLDRGLRSALGPALDRPPFAAARIRDTVFDVGRDLAVSPFRLDDHCVGGNNRRRDSLVFSLSDVVIALDIRGSGAMHAECCRAVEQGRNVFVCTGGREGNDALRSKGVPALPDSDDWTERLAPSTGS